MRKFVSLLCFLGFGLVTPPALAAEDCERVEEKLCDVRKHWGCGPIDLNSRQGKKAEKPCEQVHVVLTPTEVMPHLRRLQCLFFGEDSRIRFSGENYVAMMGPQIGDIFEVRNGTAHIPIFGHYSSMSKPTRISFENLGPGRQVVIKCNGYGPA